jgi:hypothetical protein
MRTYSEAYTLITKAAKHSSSSSSSSRRDTKISVISSRCAHLEVWALLNAHVQKHLTEAHHSV